MANPMDVLLTVRLIEGQSYHTQACWRIAAIFYSKISLCYTPPYIYFYIPQLQGIYSWTQPIFCARILILSYFTFFQEQLFLNKPSNRLYRTSNSFITERSFKGHSLSPDKEKRDCLQLELVLWVYDRKWRDQPILNFKKRKRVDQFKVICTLSINKENGSLCCHPLCSLFFSCHSARIFCCSLWRKISWQQQR